MFDGMIEFKDRVIDNASASQDTFNTFAGTNDASTCTADLGGGFSCIGNIGFNAGAVVLYLVFIAVIIGLFLGVCKVAITDGGWAALIALILFFIVSIALYFTPQLLVFFGGVVVNLS